jgi:hypothetical protein
MLGIDPTHLTLRDLLFMMEGKAQLEGAKKDNKKGTTTTHKGADNVSTMKGLFNGRR